MQTPQKSKKSPQPTEQSPTMETTRKEQPAQLSHSLRKHTLKKHEGLDKCRRVLFPDSGSSEVSVSKLHDAQENHQIVRFRKRWGYDVINDRPVSDSGWTYELLEDKPLPASENSNAENEKKPGK